MENLVSQGRLVAPREVLRELEQVDDELLRWASECKAMFHPLDQHQLDVVRAIETAFPDLVDPNKTIPDADPFVVALATSMAATVITSESARGRQKIPNVCSRYDVVCVDLVGLFKKEAWQF